MKGIAATVLVILFAILVAIAVLTFTSANPSAPHFRKIQALPAIQDASYQFLSPCPFQSGKVWINCRVPNRRPTSFLYDLERRTTDGELVEAWPISMLGDSAHVLCSQEMSTRGGLRDRLSKFLTGFLGIRIKFAGELAIYWVVDLESNRAVKLGEIAGTPNFSFVPSPDFRRGYLSRHNTRGSLDLFCFDFARQSIEKLPTHDWPAGWWDNSQIFLRTTNADFTLYDVATGKTAPFISNAQIASLLGAQGITEDPKSAQAFFTLGPGGYELYLTDTHQKWLARESFLAKVERPDGKLKLIAPRFKFEWSDHIDPTARYYVYTGREAGEDSDGVFVRDLQRGTNDTLVRPESAKYFSLPNFYSDSVIYVRSNALWRIKINGSENTRLFPPRQ